MHLVVRQFNINRWPNGVYKSVGHSILFSSRGWNFYREYCKEIYCTYTVIIIKNLIYTFYNIKFHWELWIGFLFRSMCMYLDGAWWQVRPRINMKWAQQQLVHKCVSPPPLLWSCRAQLADPSSTPHRLTPPPRRAVWLTAGGARSSGCGCTNNTSLRVLHEVSI